MYAGATAAEWTNARMISTLHARAPAAFVRRPIDKAFDKEFQFRIEDSCTKLCLGFYMAVTRFENRPSYILYSKLSSKDLQVYKTFKSTKAWEFRQSCLSSELKCKAVDKLSWKRKWLTGMECNAIFNISFSTFMRNCHKGNHGPSTSSAIAALRCSMLSCHFWRSKMPILNFTHILFVSKQNCAPC